MRILHVVECADGGVLALLRTYCAAQVAAGHEVRVLAPCGQVAGVELHPWHLDRSRPWSLPRAARELSASVQQYQPDVVHLHSFFAGLVGRLVIGRCDPAPAVVYQPHSWAYAAVRRRGSRWVVEAGERLLARRTDRLLVNCGDELAEGRRHGVLTPATAVGIPIDLRAFSPADDAGRASLRAHLAHRGHMVLCVGRLVRQKGQDRLVSAWVRDSLPDTELVLVGDGAVQEVRDLARGEWCRSVRCVGHQDDIRPWLRAADVLVVASRYEGQSVAVSEALACGLPVVACDVNGAGDAVLSAPYPAAGAVVGTDDMPALVAACRRRVLDDGLRRREAVAARQRAAALFEPSAVSTRVEDVYRTALASKARAARRRARPRGRAVEGLRA